MSLIRRLCQFALGVTACLGSFALNAAPIVFTFQGVFDSGSSSTLAGQTISATFVIDPDNFDLVLSEPGIIQGTKLNVAPGSFPNSGSVSFSNGSGSEINSDTQTQIEIVKNFPPFSTPYRLGVLVVWDDDSFVYSINLGVEGLFPSMFPGALDTDFSFYQPLSLDSAEASNRGVFDRTALTGANVDQSVNAVFTITSGTVVSAVVPLPGTIYLTATALLALLAMFYIHQRLFAFTRMRKKTRQTSPR
jgi:hypothetical protein